MFFKLDRASSKKRQSWWCYVEGNSAKGVAGHKAAEGRCAADAWWTGGDVCIAGSAGGNSSSLWIFDVHRPRDGARFTLHA